MHLTRLIRTCRRVIKVAEVLAGNSPTCIWRTCSANMVEGEPPFRSTWRRSNGCVTRRRFYATSRIIYRKLSSLNTCATNASFSIAFPVENVRSERRANYVISVIIINTHTCWNLVGKTIQVRECFWRADFFVSMARIFTLGFFRVRTLLR